MINFSLIYFIDILVKIDNDNKFRLIYGDKLSIKYFIYFISIFIIKW